MQCWTTAHATPEGPPMSIGNRQQSRDDEMAFWLAQARVERRRPQARARSLDPAVPPALLALAALAGAWLLGAGL